MSVFNPTVAITGMNAKPDNPGPGLAVARCLRESPNFQGRIIGLGYDALDPGLYLDDYCDASYLLPYPSAGDDALLDQLQMIQQRVQIDILLPCLDAELPGMVRLLPALKEMGFKTFLPTLPAATSAADESSISYGIGVDIDISKNAVLNIEYMQYLDKKNFDLGVAGAGVTLEF